MEALCTQDELLPKGTEIFFIRHSKANYDADYNQARSDSPTESINRKNQSFPDVTSEGVILARAEAAKLFAKFPKGSSVAFLTSDLQRAKETAHLYKAVAEEAGLIIEEMGKSEDGVRELHSLSLREYNPLSLDVFNSYVKAEDIETYQWDSVESEYKEQWLEAYNFIRACGVKESWGKNFHHYSQQIKERFPLLGIEDKQTLFDKQFTPLMRMAHWALKRFHNDNVKILCFGHEDYVSRIYEAKSESEGNEYQGLGNCDYFKISLNEDNNLEITTT